MLFSYGKAVEGKYFYDRTKVQKELIGFLNMKQSFMVKAPRRYGKTSLIKQIFNEENFSSIYIDLRKTPRISLVNEKVFEYIYQKAGVVGFLKKIKRNLIAFMREHRTTIKIDMELFETSIELFSNQEIDDVQKFSEVLDIADKFAKKLDTTFYIVLDEFQDIKRFNSKDTDILELLRGTIQHHQNICYIFLGSNMTLMTEIFENKKSPFFNFSRKKDLQPFDIVELSDEITRAFKTKNIVFEDKNILPALLKKLKGHPANTMMVMQNLELHVEQKELKLIKQEEIETAYESAYEELLDLIGEYTKEIQTKEHLYDVIYRLANKQKQALDNKSIYQKYSLLISMGYIQKEEKGKYFIIDNFLEEDLRRI